MNQQGLRCLVSGRVQGVCYRAYTKRKARELNITGWVRNVGDGKVEAEVFGTAEQLQVLQDWLWQGPPAAKVTAVECETIPWQEHTEFAVR